MVWYHDIIIRYRYRMRTVYLVHVHTLVPRVRTMLHGIYHNYTVYT